MANPSPPLPREEDLLPPEDWPCVDHIVTEDDTPVESLFAERQQKLLTEPLYVSWTGPGEGRRFLAAANVGVFYLIGKPPLVPDVFLSLDVDVPADIWAKRHRSYFLWEYGKPPDVAVEIVSDTRGDETGYKMQQYARIGVLYYIIWDPTDQLGEERLRAFVLRDHVYVRLEEPWLPAVGLGLTLWKGRYEGIKAEWLRWCDAQGQIIPTGSERAEQERQAKEEATRRAEQLAARLRALGIDPEA